MMTIGELASIIDQNMINFEKRKDILNCICSNINEKIPLDLLLSSLETLKYFIAFTKDCLKEKVKIIILFILLISDFSFKIFHKICLF